MPDPCTYILFPIVGGGGKIGECIATELVKEDVTIVLWDVNESKFNIWYSAIYFGYCDGIYGMIWYGMVSCGVVWCGVVWYGGVWCGVVWCGMVWWGVVWCGVVWCGVVLCGVVWFGWYGNFFLTNLFFRCM